MCRVLVVDDSAIERKGIQMLLKKMNKHFEIFVACNGEEAWEFVQHYPIDIVFTDIRMPIMDGIELLRKIKDFKAEIQTIIFSAYSDFEYTSKAIENKADHYILKPIKANEFYATVEKALNAMEKIRVNDEQEKRIIQNFVDFDAEHQSAISNDVIYEIFEAIELKKYDEIDVLVVKMFEMLKQNKALSMLYMKQVVAEIAKRLYAAVNQENKEEIFHYINKVVSMKSIEDMESKIPVLLKDICNNMKSYEKIKISPTIKKVLDIIHGRYWEDISLDVVASEVNLTPKYLSKIFKQEMNVGFVKYLTNYRLEQASKILSHTNENIAEICKKVGIQDAAYFCFIFKKKYGVSPEQYRKEAGNK